MWKHLFAQNLTFLYCSALCRQATFFQRLEPFVKNSSLRFYITRDGPLHILKWNKYNLRWTTAWDTLHSVIVYLTNTEPKCRSNVWKTEKVHSMIQYFVKPIVYQIVFCTTLSFAHISVRETQPTLLYTVVSIHWNSQHSFTQSSFKVSPQHFSQVELWAFAGPLRHLDPFVFQPFCPDLLLCLVSLSCWPSLGRSLDEGLIIE